MFNLLINLCVYVFIFYAVGRSASIIVFGRRRQRRRANASAKAVRRRKAGIVRLNVQTAKRNDRLKARKGFQPVVIIYNCSMALATPK